MARVCFWYCNGIKATEGEVSEWARVEDFNALLKKADIPLKRLIYVSLGTWAYYLRSAETESYVWQWWSENEENYWQPEDEENYQISFTPPTYNKYYRLMVQAF